MAPSISTLMVTWIVLSNHIIESHREKSLMTRKLECCGSDRRAGSLAGGMVASGWIQCWAQELDKVKPEGGQILVFPNRKCMYSTFWLLGAGGGYAKLFNYCKH